MPTILRRRHSDNIIVAGNLAQVWREPHSSRTAVPTASTSPRTVGYTVLDKKTALGRLFVIQCIGMELTKKNIEDYKVAFKKEFGEVLEDEEAVEQAHGLTRLMRLIARPMTLDEIAETLKEMGEPRNAPPLVPKKKKATWGSRTKRR